MKRVTSGESKRSGPPAPHAKGALNEPALRDLETVMRDSSICGLGQAAPNPVNHLLTLFKKGS